MHRSLAVWVFRAVLGTVLVVALALLGLLLTAQFPPEPLADKGVLLGYELTGRFRASGGEISEFRLYSSGGLEVDIAVLRPDRLLPGRPLVLLMGGQETGRAAVQVLPDTRGVMVAAISYPFGTVPHRDPLRLAIALPRIQRGIFDTPAVALLALDFLESKEADLAPGWIEMAGISFGAYLAPVPAVLDARVERLWLVHGGAAPARVLEHGLRKRLSPGVLRRAVAAYLAAVAGSDHLAPEQWLPRFAPRPAVLVHARADDDLPAEAITALHGAVRGPVDILWTEGKHVHPKRPGVIAEITDILFSRIALGPPPGPSSEAFPEPRRGP